MRILGFNLDFKKTGKTQERSQMLLMLTADSRLVPREVPVKTATAVDDQICGGFLLDSSNQYRDEVTGHWFQIVDEKSGIPLNLLTTDKEKEEETVKTELDEKGKPKKESKQTLQIRGVFHHSWTMDLATLNLQAAQDKKTNMLYLALVIAVTAGMVIIGMTAF